MPASWCAQVLGGLRKRFQCFVAGVVPSFHDFGATVGDADEDEFFVEFEDVKLLYQGWLLASAGCVSFLRAGLNHLLESREQILRVFLAFSDPDVGHP